MTNHISIYLLSLAVILSGCNSSALDKERFEEEENRELLGFRVTMQSGPFTRSGSDESSATEENRDTVFVEDDIYIASEVNERIEAPVTRGAPMKSGSEVTSLRINRYQGVWSSSLPVTSNIDATKSGVSFSYKPSFVWVIDETKQNFLVYSPTPSADNGITESTDGRIITYEVPTDVTKHPDICVSKFADHKDIVNTGSGEHIRTVNLRHVLTGIGFSVRGYKVQIKSVSISGVKTKGSFPLSDDNGEWTLNTTADKENSAGITQSVWNVKWTGSWSNCTTTNGYLMMIPQTLTDDAKLKVVYVYSEGLEAGIEQTFTSDLKKLTDGVWRRGSLITYNIRLKTTPVVVSDMTLNHYLPGYTTQQPMYFTDLASDDNLTFEWKETWLRIHRGTPTYGSSPSGAGSGWTTGTGGPWNNIYFYATEENRSTSSNRTATITVRGTKSVDRTFKVTQPITPTLVMNRATLSILDYNSRPWEAGQLDGAITYTTNYPQNIQVTSNSSWLRATASNGRIYLNYDWNVNGGLGFDRTATLKISVVVNGITYLSREVTVRQNASDFWILLDSNKNFVFALMENDTYSIGTDIGATCLAHGAGLRAPTRNEVYAITSALNQNLWISWANYTPSLSYWTSSRMFVYIYSYRLSGTAPNISSNIPYSPPSAGMFLRCLTTDKSYLRLAN